MRKSTLPDKNVIVAYWLNAELTNTFACPPLRDVACFTQQMAAEPTSSPVSG